MDRARNSITGEEYHAPDISEQHLAQPEKDRDLWLAQFRIANPTQCLGCGNKASFCKRSSNGRSAKFSAHHSLGCAFSSLKQEEAAEKEPEEFEKVPSRDNDGSITVIMHRMMNPEPDGSTVPERTPHPKPGNSTRRTHVLPQTGETSHNIRRTLGTLLRDLLYSADFPDDQHWVEVPERGQAREADYFRRADQATERDRGRHMAYWGQVLDVRRSQDGNTYINTGPWGNDTVALMLTPLMFNQLRTTLKIKDLSSLSSKYFIVQGIIKPGHRKIVPVTDLSLLAFHSPSKNMPNPPLGMIGYPT